MNLETVNLIKSILSKNSEYSVEVLTEEYLYSQESDLAGCICSFHAHVNKWPNIGIFKVSCSKQNIVIQLVFTNYEPDDQDTYRMHIFSGNRTEAFGEFYEIRKSRNGFRLYLSTKKYKPMKRDGKNIKRKEIFEKDYGTLTVELPIADTFLSEVCRYSKVRHKADNLTENA